MAGQNRQQQALQVHCCSPADVLCMNSNDGVALEAAAGSKLTLEERAALERTPCMRVARAMLKDLMGDTNSFEQSLAG